MINKHSTFRLFKLLQQSLFSCRQIGPFRLQFPPFKASLQNQWAHAQTCTFTVHVHRVDADRAFAGVSILRPAWTRIRACLSAHEQGSPKKPISWEQSPLLQSNSTASILLSSSNVSSPRLEESTSSDPSETVVVGAIYFKHVTKNQAIEELKVFGANESSEAMEQLRIRTLGSAWPGPSSSSFKR